MIFIQRFNNSQLPAVDNTIYETGNVIKDWLKRIPNGIYQKCGANFSIDQFGFYVGLVTRETLCTLQMLLQS